MLTDRGFANHLSELWSVESLVGDIRQNVVTVDAINCAESGLCAETIGNMHASIEIPGT
jgi:hypothetical protein